MNVSRLRQSMSDFGDAVNRLEEVLNLPPEISVNRDSTLLRFTFVYELSWNTMKRCLAHVGITVRNPRETLQHAYQQHWIDNERLWLDMMTDRNLVAHTYKEDMAMEVYERIKGYAPVFRKTHTFLQEKFADIPTDAG